MASLEVHLYLTHIGDLVGDSWRDFDFVATSPEIDRFGVGSTVLWESVALVPHQPRGKAARRRVFFDELLPEGAARQRLAERVRIAPAETFGLLARVGDRWAHGHGDQRHLRALTNPSGRLHCGSRSLGCGTDSG